jgi:hypothetical protein
VRPDEPAALTAKAALSSGVPLFGGPAAPDEKAAPDSSRLLAQCRRSQRA